MFSILSQITLNVIFFRNEEQHCLLSSLVNDFVCVRLKNALLTHILSTLFSNTSVLFSCTPFVTKTFIYTDWNIIVFIHSSIFWRWTQNSAADMLANPCLSTTGLSNSTVNKFQMKLKLRLPPFSHFTFVFDVNMHSVFSFVILHLEIYAAIHW